MQFDDRLATVLQMRVNGAAAARTQYRQLLDLLGADGSERSQSVNASLAYRRLTQLHEAIPALERAAILREPGQRLRNADLTAFLADGDSATAAAAMATARLTEEEWIETIPCLPLVARGMLRHRRDLPPAAVRLLGQLGVGDLVLRDERDLAAEPALQVKFSDKALPAQSFQVRKAVPTSPPANASLALESAGLARASIGENTSKEPIGAIIERIEQFRSARRMPVLAPRLPLGDAPLPDSVGIAAFDATTDASGIVVWASASVAPWLVGMELTGKLAGSLVQFSRQDQLAIARHQPLHEAALTISAAPAISGKWRIDAAPIFVRGSGAFVGYRCRVLRALASSMQPPESESAADRMRQTLHELRTPVNAIQGFAEIIQQQLFGAVPHEYRAHAAAIAADAARLLAGFEDLEHLARLETGAAAPDAGEADLRDAVEETVSRLQSVMQAREARFALDIEGADFRVPLSEAETMRLCWQLLASAAAASGAREEIALRLESSAGQIRFILALPEELRAGKGPIRQNGSGRTAVSTGLFGPKFAFRMVAAQANAAGGDLNIAPDKLTLTMPVLTSPTFLHSRVEDQTGA